MYDFSHETYNVKFWAERIKKYEDENENFSNSTFDMSNQNEYIDYIHKRIECKINTQNIKYANNQIKIILSKNAVQNPILDFIGRIFNF